MVVKPISHQGVQFINRIVPPHNITTGIGIFKSNFIGPERWVTVPDGYDGISVNRG